MAVDIICMEACASVDQKASGNSRSHVVALFAIASSLAPRVVAAAANIGAVVESASNGKNRSADPRIVKCGSNSISIVIAISHEKVATLTIETGSAAARMTARSSRKEHRTKNPNASNSGKPPVHRSHV